jgi:hypothetical protein
MVYNRIVRNLKGGEKYMSIEKLNNEECVDLLHEDTVDDFIDILVELIDKRVNKILAERLQEITTKPDSKTFVDNLRKMNEKITAEK